MMETDGFQRLPCQMCKQSSWPESLQCRQMPWAIFRMVRPFMVLWLSSGAVRSGRVMFLSQIHFPPNIFKYVGHGGRQI